MKSGAGCLHLKPTHAITEACLWHIPIRSKACGQSLWGSSNAVSATTLSTQGQLAFSPCHAPGFPPTLFMKDRPAQWLLRRYGAACNEGLAVLNLTVRDSRIVQNHALYYNDFARPEQWVARV